MYEFTEKNGWKEIEDFLEKQNPDDFNKSLTESGYHESPQFSLGITEAYNLDLHTRSLNSRNNSEKYELLAIMDVGSYVYTVALPKLPDYVSFINMASPGLKNVSELIIQAEKNI